MIQIPHLDVQKEIVLILDNFLNRKVNFITGSSYAAEKLRITIGLKNVISIHTGVIDLYNKKSYRDELNLQNDVFYFFCGAIFQERKGHRVLIEAFERFLDKVGKNNIVLILAGEGEILGSIRDQVRLKMLESNIVFVGHVVEVGKFLNSVDCAVLASLSDEDFPNIVMEAMSCSLPLIATEVAGVPEQIGNDCGILCKPGSIDDLLDAMLTIYGSRNLASKLGQNSRQRYLSYFTRDAAVSNYVSYIKDNI
jgi:glycosyltransferase involved in cell wall biosynthesis